MSRLFSQDLSIDPTKLIFQPFWETQRVKNFDCGVIELNDFLNTDEVEQYQKNKLGQTTLVYYEGEVVGYYTLSNDGLRIDYVKTTKGFSKLGEMRINQIPGIKIGRLAIDNKWQARGIGRSLIQRIAMKGFDTDHYGDVACRLLIVEAKEQAFNFYKKAGFQFTYKSRKEKSKLKHRGTRTMFFDLWELDYLKSIR